MKANTRLLVLLSVFVGIGAVLHFIVPPLLFGMKPDMLLTMMFLGIMLVPKISYAVLLAVVTGIISALTTGFPGGQIANMVDKPLTALLFFGLFLIIRHKVPSQISATTLTAIGTIISGSIFLFTGLYIVGLAEGAFIPLFLTIVLPTTAVNTLIMIVLFPVVQTVARRSQLIPTT